jgi:type IV pilus assembly protein PilC
MTFSYQVRDPLGKTYDGTIEAANEDDAIQTLRRDGLHVLKIEAAETPGVNLFAKRVSKKEIVYVTNQLAVMVDTGITLSVAMEGIAEQEENPTLKSMLLRLKKRVEGGEDFSTALTEFPKHFNRTYVSLVKAAEHTGQLGAMLERISGYLQKELDMRGKVRASMAYPAVMLAVATGVTLFLLTYILPKFTPLFTKKGIKLPKPTILMMTVSDAMLNYWYGWLIGIVVAIGLFLWGKRTERGRQALDWVKLNLPIIGAVNRKVVISRSLRTLGAMVGAGVSIIDALKLSAEVSGNFFYERLWMKVLDDVTAGDRICDSLAGEALFPSTLVQMIGAGENTGKLDHVLEKVSSHYDQEVEMSIKTATSLIEPMMITVMGVVVGGIGMSLLLPIFSLSRGH